MLSVLNMMLNNAYIILYLILESGVRKHTNNADVNMQNKGKIS